MPTSKDVARAAGVAQSTVSYVMSGKRPVSEETRKKVEATIRELTYQPNAGARALVSRKTKIIGLVIPFGSELHASSVMGFISRIAGIARRHDYDILLVTEDEGADGLRRVVGQQICDGLILMQVQGEDDRLPLVRTLQVPVVLIGIPHDPAGLTCIDADFEMAGRLCIEELADAGHGTASVIGWPHRDVEKHFSYVERFMRGIEIAAEARGVEVLHLQGGTERSVILESVEKGLAGSRGIPAFVAPDSTVQEILQQCLLSLGLTPGSDVAIIGGSTDLQAERQIVPLTNIDLRPDEVSLRAVRTLCALLDDGPQGPPDSLELVPPAIHHRQSTLQKSSSL